MANTKSKNKSTINTKTEAFNALPSPDKIIDKCGTNCINLNNLAKRNTRKSNKEEVSGKGK